MKSRLLALLLAASAATGVAAQDYTVTPGSLGVTIFPDPATTYLGLSGSVNGADLDYIATHCRQLSTLDLSKVDIVLLNSNKRLTANVTAHNADVLPPGQLAGLKASTLRLPESITEIGDWALTGADIRTVSIPASVTAIGKGAFAACRNLTGVTVPATVKSVGADAFNGCTSLVSATYASAAVPDGCFRGCTSLRSVILAPEVTSIGARAFDGCTSLATVNVPEAVTAIGDEAFAASGLTDISLSECGALRSVGARAFAECASLTSVRLPEGVTTLGSGVFFGDTSLSTVNIPGTVKAVPDMAFKGDAAITDASSIMPEGVETVGALAYQGLNDVNSAVFPSTLVYIGDGAFEGWTAVNTFDAGPLSEVPALGEDVWAGVDQKNVVLAVAEGMENDFLAADQWKEFAITQSGSTGIKLNGSEPRVKVRFEGTVLHIESSLPMETAMLHGIDGAMVAMADPAGATNASIDTSAILNPLFILTVRLDGGTSATLKLLRK